MLRNTPITERNECCFCTSRNPSYLELCERCKGAIVPTSDKSQKQLEWTIFSFDSVAPVSERIPFSHFPDAMDIFYTQERVAIHLKDTFIKHILIRHGRNTAYYSVHRIGEDYKKMKTTKWVETGEEARASLSHFVDENLDNKGNTRKSNLLEFGLKF